VHRQGRVVTVFSTGGPAVAEEARAFRPASIDVAPVTLKEIFLESVRTED
jgi:hypothetical protein